jgi:molybdopterin synthase sulfur carrier subunit
VKLTLRFFAGLKEQLGRDAEEIDVPAGVATVAALRTHLVKRGGEWQAAFAEKKLVRAAVNQEMAPAAATIKAGDEVAFFPPVTGG